MNSVLIQGIFAQTNKQQITDIDKARQEIRNNIQNFQKIEKVRDSTGSRYVYLKEKELQLITVNYRDKNVDKTVEWYFSNGQLIYSEQVWTEIKSNKTIDNEKFYLSNGHLISWTKEDIIVDNNSQEFMDVDAQLTTYASKLIEDAK
jgi:hypothetical protein